MGRIELDSQALQRLLQQAGESRAVPYQKAFNELARSHRGRPPSEIVPLLRRAATAALLDFRHRDLVEQAQAISEGAPYELRIAVK
ncbi:hypothetical protein [Streptomyces sp. NEAU-S7GS2]|uniref:hypothetical protein n=1 Tax=Streptomyces sp. NEAU-S7GS2 TaxID=2202000 RepID=UPI000D6F2933|nr:hypothetical protein [Streptomyces sp. NEAU-S7GS2]AWN32604.1 hypothetical protein DKG71_42245 [Streptomyces sp. NEAU-S7GS2]